MISFDEIKNRIREIVDLPTYEQWVAPLDFISIKNKIILLGSSDNKRLSWLKDNLLEKLNTYLKKDFDLTVRLVSLNDDEDCPGIQPSYTPATNHFDSNLQKKFTFDSFVQLDQNRMAYSFAHSVAEFPGKSYNPLYIYSDVGLGKTHLMYAIGNKIRENFKNMQVLYLTTNDLMKEYVEHARFSKGAEFTRKYTSVDVLLIDDIQYITRWGGTREQFYYIFNKLIQIEKQIVICSDKHPDNIPDLEDRIKSRFEWGGLVDILHYDLEGRMAILKRKVDERKRIIKNDFDIPDEVIEYLASSIKDNIRKLEGALNRLIGFANLKFSDTSQNVVNLSFAKEALKPYISLRKKIVTIEEIQEFIAKRYNIQVVDLISKNNKQEIAFPRQVAMFLCKKITDIPLHEIGARFGGKHHTTVLHSINKIEKEIENDNELSRKVEDFIEFFK